MPVALLGEATEHSQEYSQPNPGSVKSDSGRQRLDIDSASMPQHGSSEQSSEQSTTTTARRNRRWSARHTADSRSDEARHAQQMDHPITDSRALLSPQSGPEQSEEHRQTSQQVGHPSQTEALPCPSPPLPQQQQQPDPQHLYGRYLQHGYSHEIFGSQTEALNPMLSHMACVVCQQVLRDPHSCIRCGQSMCSPCLAALPVINTQAMPNVVSCPMCRQLASRAAWPANMHLRRMLGDLVVTCTERQEKKDANGPSPSEATDWAYAHYSLWTFSHTFGLQLSVYLAWQTRRPRPSSASPVSRGALQVPASAVPFQGQAQKLCPSSAESVQVASYRVSTVPRRSRVWPAAASLL